MATLQSRDNPRVKRWQRLVRDARARHDEGRAMLEGLNAVEGWLRARGAPVALVLTETAAALPGVRALGISQPVLVSDAVMKAIADTPSPQGVLAEIEIPVAATNLAASPGCVFLDALQDAGNLGTILRTALAFGVRDVVLGPGCVDAWSPKVLRAAAGAHAGIRIEEPRSLVEAMARFGGKVHCTVPRGGIELAQADLGGRTGWLFGAEGRGVGADLLAAASSHVSIPMAREAESLNVAACAAICLYETARRRAQ